MYFEVNDIIMRPKKKTILYDKKEQIFIKRRHFKLSIVSKAELLNLNFELNISLALRNIETDQYPIIDTS